MSSKVASFPGTEISVQELRAGRYLLTKHLADLKYAWSTGEAISRFLGGLRQGEIWGRRCRRCGRTMVPPRMYCEVCFRPTDQWIRLRDTGSVVTYSISYVNADASRREAGEPILVSVIEIDGATPMMGVLHLLGEVDPDEVSVGMKVEAVWRPKGERKGAITDIKYFRPSRGRPHQK